MKKLDSDATAKNTSADKLPPPTLIDSLYKLAISIRGVFG
jgi:hypothetical protein